MKTFKTIILFLISLVAVFLSSTSSGQNKTITLWNKSNRPIYVYNFNYGAPTSVQPITGGAPLSNGVPLTIQLQPNPKMRIYISDKKLEKSLEKGIAPDPFNPAYDGAIMYSFVEYNYEPSNSRYTFDLSYIDEYSQPVTVKFSNVGSYGGCQEGFEYGFTKLSSVIDQLKKQTDYSWKKLVWPLTNAKGKWPPPYPDNIFRVVGPNKVWAASPNNILQPWVPITYQPFVNSLPANGAQLFSSVTNWNGWQYWDASHIPSPSNTGYVKALHAAAIPDSKGKYGFFCFPNDNKTGEFTWVPTSVNCTVTVYPYDS
ncbi:hypothetical protein P0136_12525 [Lentisphaerota bacterium ZTH]|nr:hypothetical protein JYG24_09960 [Lentisphaerota bacterium]WET06183.1 hypothetical protein P0136_12525 [Lentisphaerota bacterium ZTH]